MTPRRPLTAFEQVAFDARLKAEREHQPHGWDCPDFEYEAAAQTARAMEKVVRAKVAADLRKQAQGYVELGDMNKASLFESAARIAEEGTQT